MSFARIRLLLAAMLFLAWLAWLATAVRQKGTVQIVSRAQLTAASYLVLAEVDNQEGLPSSKVEVKQVLNHPEGAIPAGEIEVTNLMKSATPIPVQGNTRTPPSGLYLLPLVKDGDNFRIAGLPPSPGYAGEMDPTRPVIYPWSPDVQTQLRKLNLWK